MRQNNEINYGALLSWLTLADCSIIGLSFVWKASLVADHNNTKTDLAWEE